MSINRQTQILETLVKTYTATEAVRTSTVQEDLFVNGYAFTAHGVITIVPGTNRYFHFNAMDCRGNYQYVFNPLILLGVDAGPIAVNISYAPTLTAGGRTPLNVFNLRGTSTNTVKAVVEEVAAANVSSTGTVFIPKLIPSVSTATAFGGAPAVGLEGLPFELNPAVNYLIEFDNEDSVNARLEYEIDFFEIPI